MSLFRRPNPQGGYQDADNNLLQTFYNNGMQISISDLLESYSYENDPASQLTLGDKTINKTTYDNKNRLSAIKQPAAYIEKYNSELETIKENTRTRFKKYFMRYLKEPFLMTKEQARARAAEVLNQEFQREFQDLNTQYSYMQTAEQLAKGKSSNTDNAGFTKYDVKDVIGDANQGVIEKAQQ